VDALQTCVEVSTISCEACDWRNFEDGFINYMLRIDT
jgi:hypothetical protein